MAVMERVARDKVERLGMAGSPAVNRTGATSAPGAPARSSGEAKAALAAGLTAGGLDAGVAVSAVLLYRLVTFWLPTVPGYWAFNWLTKKGAL